MKRILHLFITALLLPAFDVQLSTAFAQGTAFTYQGKLNNNGAPANGSYDLAFTLFTNSATGSALAGPVTNAAVAVTNGLFTTLVDFGNAFNGTSNWLAIAVSTNGANTFIPLTPRQQVTPTPYAIYAESANAANLVGTIPAGNLSGAALLDGGNVFTGQQIVIGTASDVAAGGSIDPSVFLHVNNIATDGNFSTPDVAGIGFGQNSTRQAIVGGTYGNDFIDFYTGAQLTYAKVRIDSAGNVGIGTTTPNSDSLLQVKGMVRMGSETGTSEAPNKSILVRRINSTSDATNQVLATSLGGIMTLIRDGTPGGLVIKINGAYTGVPQITGFGINASGATTNVYSILYVANNTSTQIFTDAQHVGYVRLSFGDAAYNSDFTTVEMMRAVDNFGNNLVTWVGTVTTTVNQ